MVFYGDNLIVTVLNAITFNITGSEFLTLSMIVLLLVAICLMFRMPIELTIPIILPLLIVISIATSEMVTSLGVALLYGAIILAKKWIAN